MTTPPSFPLGEPYVGRALCLAERDGQPAHADPDGAGADHARFLVELCSDRRSDGAPLPGWPRYEAQSPRRIGFPGGGAVEEISADAYAQEHHCALWDALAREKAP
jgi:hypothetical protein